MLPVTPQNGLLLKRARLAYYLTLGNDSAKTTSRADSKFGTPSIQRRKLRVTISLQFFITTYYSDNDSKTILCSAWYFLCSSNAVQMLIISSGRSAVAKSWTRSTSRQLASVADNPPSSRPSLSRGLSPNQLAADAGEPLDATSRILDAIPKPPTSRTSQITDSLNSAIEDTKSLQAGVNAHISSRLLSFPEDPSSISPLTSATISPKSPADIRGASGEASLPPTRYPDLKTLHKHRNALSKLAKLGTAFSRPYDPLEYFHSPPSPDQITLPMLLAAQSHLGHATSLWNPRNSSYIFGIRDGIHIISLDITAAYLRRAAKIVTEVARRGGIILFVGTRDGQEEIVVNAAKRAGAYHVFDRWTPGSLTNGQQILGDCRLKAVDLLDNELPQYTAKLRPGSGHPVLRPDLVICLNPLENEACLHECGLYNVPTIGIIDTDANPSWVTYPIPANDDSLRCITLLAGVLGRAGEEGQRLRIVEAKKGKATYSTKFADDFLKSLDELQELDLQDTSEPSK